MWHKRHARTRDPWWTKARVIEGLQRFYRDFGVAPTATHEYQQRQQFTGTSVAGVGNPYPSSYGVLKYFRTYRQAWTAAGVAVDRAWEEWTAEEDRFITEGAGILTRNELGEMLDRSPDAVKRRLYDLGVNTREARGWTFNRVERVTGVPPTVLRRYADQGKLAYFRGTRLIYIDPADLLVVAEIDWQSPPAELEQAVRQSLMQRLVAILSGRDWRAGRLYQAHCVLKTDHVYKRRHVPKPTPNTTGIKGGDWVRVWRRVPKRTHVYNRVGVVKAVLWSHWGQMSDVKRPRTWVARVEFKREGKRPRVHATLPLSALIKRECDVGDAIRARREAIGFRQSDVAEVMGQRTMWVSKIECGRLPVMPQLLREFAAVFDCKPEELMPGRV